MIRVDSHQHFWQLKRGDYSWLSPEHAAIYRDFMPNDLQPLIQQMSVDKTIVVQAAPTLEESKFILTLANQHDFIAGVVGWVNMESKRARYDLDNLAENKKLLGIRPLIQDISDPDWMLKRELDAVFLYLIEYDLTFDALVYPIHLPNIKLLQKRYPDLKIVIDHGAKPSIAKSLIQVWAADIEAIANHPNTYCKLSGLLTEAGVGAGERELFPYMQVLWNCFGAERLMWGSDWPVVNSVSSYRFWHALTGMFLNNFDESSRTQVLGGTACDFYGLDKNTGDILKKQ